MRVATLFLWTFFVLTAPLMSGCVKSLVKSNPGSTQVSSPGGSSPTASITVPTISYSSATGAVGVAMSVTPTSFTDGGDTTTCSASSLPAGLSINASTCVISGTPTAAVSATAYTISATNSAGSSTASVSLTVAAAVSLPTISYASSSGRSGTVGVAMSITPSTLSNGGATVTCSASSLPAGLSINASTCVISGTPTVVVSATAYTITATNSVGPTTSSVTLTVAAAVVACPTGYIPVSANASLGVSSFCVMKYEAKNVAGVATSQAASTPWGNISATNAKTKCTDLGANYDLISNPEWMTIAYDAERTGSNWSGGNPGSGAMYRGHSDNSPGSILAVTDAADSYNGTGNTSAQAMGSGKEQRRTFTLSNGEVLWDFAGNLDEWVDWTLGGGFNTGPTTCNESYSAIEIPVVSCAALQTLDYMPSNPAGVTPAVNYNSNYGLGRFYVGRGGTAIRGGSWGAGASAGAFGINTYFGATQGINESGFRCVYRPTSAPSISFAGSSGTNGNPGLFMRVIPSLGSGSSEITNCTASPALPSGLSINASTCVISGTPTVVVSATAYTITATNSAGSSTASVSLTVAAAVGIKTAGLVFYVDTEKSASYTGSVATWYDLSGKMNHAILGAGSPTYNSSEKAMYLNGSNFIINNPIDFPMGSSQRTIGGWYKLNSSCADYVGLFQYGTTQSHSNFEIMCHNNKAAFGLWYDDVFSSFTFSTGVWYNISITLSNTGYINIYVNGVSYANVVPVGGPVNTISTNGYIGAHNGGTSSVNMYTRMNYIYNTGLSASEVLDNFNNTKSRFGY